MLCSSTKYLGRDWSIFVVSIREAVAGASIHTPSHMMATDLEGGVWRRTIASG